MIKLFVPSDAICTHYVREFLLCQPSRGAMEWTILLKQRHLFWLDALRGIVQTLLVQMLRFLKGNLGSQSSTSNQQPLALIGLSFQMLQEHYQFVCLAARIRKQKHHTPTFLHFPIIG